MGLKKPDEERFSLGSIPNRFGTGDANGASSKPNDHLRYACEENCFINSMMDSG